MGGLKNRILQIADYYGIEKPADFAKKTGFSHQVASNYLKGVRVPNADALCVIKQTFDISANWLLTGEGDMLAKSENSPVFSTQQRGVPFYDVDFCGGFDMMVNDQTIVPSGYIDFPEYNRADSWARITGHSMEPLISNGDIIALRKVEDWQSYLLYGEIYGVMTSEYRTVKRIRKTNNPANLLLEPISKDFDPTEVRRDMITGVWQVLGCAKKFF